MYLLRINLQYEGINEISHYLLSRIHHRTTTEALVVALNVDSRIRWKLALISTINRLTLPGFGLLKKGHPSDNYQRYWRRWPTIWWVQTGSFLPTQQLRIGWPVYRTFLTIFVVRWESQQNLVFRVLLRSYRQLHNVVVLNRAIRK